MLDLQRFAGCSWGQVWIVIIATICAVLHQSSSATTTEEIDNGTENSSYLSEEGCPRWEKSPWCPCYQLEDGLFLECPNTGLEEIRATLALISAPIKSLSIYHLDPNVTVLPNGIFENVTVYHLQISHTEIETIQEHAFSGLEFTLDSLSLVNSKLKEIPQGSLNKLVTLRTLDFDSNLIESVESYALYGLLITSLNLQNNQIALLTEYAFGGLENTLEELILINNKLKQFPLNALRRLRNLKTLRLVWNEIEDIPDDGFTRFTSLQRVDLSSNKIKMLDERSFVTMPRLTSLSLYMNRLTTLNDTVFVYLRELESLDVSHNSLTSLAGRAFSHVKKLRTIDLSFNHLHSISSGAFHNLTHLREIFLTNNIIKKITNDTFFNTSQISVLFIPNNAITHIECGTFYHLHHLYQLQLSFNQLRDIHRSMFKNNRELRSLSLDNNLITELQPGTFQELVELRDLRLQNNLLKTIKKGVFYSLPNIQELHLQILKLGPKGAIEKLVNLEVFSVSKNMISIIQDAAFKSNKNMKKLVLSSNNIVTIEPDAFQHLAKLKELDLSNNTLKSFSSGVFDPLKNLDKLIIDGNTFSYLPNTLLNSPLKNLRILSVNRNPMVRIRQDLSTTGSFKSLETLRINRANITIIASHDFLGFRNIAHLSLRHNKIVKISPGAFKPLTKLTVLDIGYNNIDILPEERLYGLKKLKTLNLTCNRIIELPVFSEDVEQLEILDVSGNQLHKVEGVTFRHLYNLKTLWMQNNQITWIQSGAFVDLGSLLELNLENNKLTQINGNILMPIEVRVSKLLLAGNPFFCDCRLLSFWEWVQEHTSLIQDAENESKTLTCIMPDKLKDHAILSLHPVDICPAPFIADLEVIHLDHESLIIKWNVQNGTLIDDFLVTYHLTSSRESGLISSEPLPATQRRFQLETLKPETWYTVCVTAAGKYLRTLGKPIPYVTMEGKSQPAVPDNGNHKCLQIKTLAKLQKTKMSLSTLGIILGSSISAALVLTLSVLLTAIKFRRRRRRRPVKNDVPQEYISYRHFSLQSSEGNWNVRNASTSPSSRAESSKSRIARNDAFS
ncbi:Insulin-like growth factor-binding protein like [Argiope bruennichi]|uniref:Insulin-like growth factor-binding protein like n=1 Tax=Argiope bruennichi TaxID=94029 RepID=A0A8T0FHX1_ARGBR|nr:Insulin-like growth factor-binding protein like [Argiope bruennichi]